MNRVVLSGRLAGQPRLAYTAAGMAVTAFRLEVPRSRPDTPGDAAVDTFDCVVVNHLAQEVATWGDPGLRLNVEGRLRIDCFDQGDGHATPGVRIHVDTAYFLDPVPELPLKLATPASRVPVGWGESGVSD